jgi:hypothetical protein
MLISCAVLRCVVRCSSWIKGINGGRSVYEMPSLPTSGRFLVPSFLSLLSLGLRSTKYVVPVYTHASKDPEWGKHVKKGFPAVLHCTCTATVLYLTEAKFFTLLLFLSLHTYLFFIHRSLIPPNTRGTF